MINPCYRFVYTTNLEIRKSIYNLTATVTTRVTIQNWRID